MELTIRKASIAVKSIKKHVRDKRSKYQYGRRRTPSINCELRVLSVTPTTTVEEKTQLAEIGFILLLL